MQNQPEVGFRQLGLIPFTQRLDMPPSALPPAAVAQNCWPPHSLASPPLPSESRNTTKGGWAVASGQWDLGGESGPGQEGRVGADRERAKRDLRQNHGPASSALGRAREGRRGWGDGAGASLGLGWGRMCSRDAARAKGNHPNNSSKTMSASAQKKHPRREEASRQRGGGSAWE